MKLVSRLLLFLFILGCGCGTESEDETPDLSKSAEGDGNDASADMEVGCTQVLGHTVDLAIPCKKFSEADQDLGCLPCSDAFCSGLAAEGCYISADKKVVINSETISAPFDSLLNMGWSYCSDNGENISVADLPLCD